ncbi:hypothetical protein Hanom_Chr16g01449141 [Helianthus anomalus]
MISRVPPLKVSLPPFTLSYASDMVKKDQQTKPSFSFCQSLSLLSWGSKNN